MATDDDPVFKALADPTRRHLLDRLLARDGRTLTQLEPELEMTRFGVMKHLRVLEDAGLIITRRSGREKLHFLNPVNIRLIHDRWIGKYTESHVSALADLKAALEADEVTRVYRVYIRATAEALWDAISSGRWTPPNASSESEVIDADRPRRLVQTWRMRPLSATPDEPPTTITWEIEAAGSEVCRVTVIHDLTGAPLHASLFSGDRPEDGGGWPLILSDLKSLLETGAALLSERSLSSEPYAD